MKKPLDWVKHTKLINWLNSQKLDCSDITLININLHLEQTASIKIGDNVSDSRVPITRGGSQGCIPSPLRFNLHSKKVFQDTLENIKQSIKVNGKIINNLTYTDDTAISANSSEGLQRLMETVTKEVLRLTPRRQKQEFLDNKRPRPRSRSRTRIEYAMSAFLKMKSLLTNTTLNTGYSIWLRKNICLLNFPIWSGNVDRGYESNEITRSVRDVRLSKTIESINRTYYEEWEETGNF
ncbi:hypothetical protein ILUMI_12753 [Ignelater luminosus]|uniref:Reverse transcriptase domain-containing protein n=1 Tax=Ignelater luminosus TaxID=2038154 RepID=A0A8K0CTL5_IGNLU|nr:hypothetical protein ILUMI_12753 [Ignelater luminosus]